MSGRARRTVTFALLAALAVVVLVAAALTVPGAARADDTCSISWRGGAGSWTDPARWSPARVPVAGDDVCVVRAADAGPASVRITEAVAVDGLTLRGATLALPVGAALDVTQLIADRAALAGGGMLRGGAGRLDIGDTALRGTQVSTSGGLVLAGRVTFTAAATIGGSGFVDMRPGVRIVDGDGNGGNRISLVRFPLYLQGPTFVGVRLALSDVVLLAQGDVVLAKLDNLDADGRLQAFSRSNLQLGATNGGSLTLPRTVTSIGARTTLYAGDIRTPDGTDALAALGEVDGTLSLDRTLYANGSITVRGRLTASAPVNTSEVRVRPGGYVDVDRVPGALTCGGRCQLAGAHLGSLAVLRGATPFTDLTAPITVDGAARLAGDLTVSVYGRGPEPGDTLVLLTAARGVVGTFDSVTTDRPGREVVAGYQPRYVTGTLTAAGG